MLKDLENISLLWNHNRREMAKLWKKVVGNSQDSKVQVQQQSQQRMSLQPYLRLITVLNTLMHWSFYLLLVTCRRLLTQLEAAKGSRGGAAGDSKPAPAKGPDGVVLYELHSRPEQEKFTESAKVQVWITNERKQREKGVCVCLGPVERCCHCQPHFLCSVSVDCRAGEASCRAGDCSWLWIRQTGAHSKKTHSIVIAV